MSGAGEDGAAAEGASQDSRAHMLDGLATGVSFETRCFQQNCFATSRLGQPKPCKGNHPDSIEALVK